MYTYRLLAAEIGPSNFPVFKVAIKCLRKKEETGPGQLAAHPHLLQYQRQHRRSTAPNLGEFLVTLCSWSTGTSPKGFCSPGNRTPQVSSLQN